MIPSAETFSQDALLEILEVRAAERERPVTITAAIAAQAIQAICTALSEQLDRGAVSPAETAEDVLARRDEGALVARLQPLAAADAHAVMSFSKPELEICLHHLTRYVLRADGEHYQAPELRDRLQVIDQILPVLRDAQVQAVKAAGDGSDRADRRYSLTGQRGQISVPIADVRLVSWCL